VRGWGLLTDRFRQSSSSGEVRLRRGEKIEVHGECDMLIVQLGSLAKGGRDIAWQSDLADSVDL